MSERLILKSEKVESDLKSSYTYSEFSVPLSQIDPKYLDKNKDYVLKIEFSKDWDGDIELDEVNIYEDKMETQEEADERARKYNEAQEERKRKDKEERIAFEK